MNEEDLGTISPELSFTGVKTRVSNRKFPTCHCYQGRKSARATISPICFHETQEDVPFFPGDIVLCIVHSLFGRTWVDLSPYLCYQPVQGLLQDTYCSTIHNGWFLGNV